MKWLWFILTLSFTNAFSQTSIDSLNTKYLEEYPTFIPNNLSTHPFGVFISRIQHNFQLKPAKNSAFTFSWSNGNVWMPLSTAYRPLNKSDQELMRSVEWLEREDAFYQLDIPADRISMHADAVYRFYHLRFELPLSDKHELKISTRAFSLDRGKAPYSFFTNDQSIEWFHRNVAGGIDPFGREYYGIHQTNITFTDDRGRSFELDNNTFIWSGAELSYYYYPDFNRLNKRNYYLNMGMQLGGNFHEINPSMDLGLNTTLSKKVPLKKRNEILFAISLGGLYQDLIEFKDAVKFSDRAFLFSIELMMNYRKQLNDISYFSVAGSYYIQSNYNRKRDSDFLILSGNREATSHWHYGVSHLYRYITSNSLIFSYGIKNWAFSVYMREDFLVDNAPDAQTGVGMKLFLNSR